MKKIIMGFTVLIFVFLSGCSSAPPSSPKEELVMYRWVQTETDGQERFAVWFDDFFHIQCRIAQTELQENYQLSDTQIVTVNSLCGSRTIDYNIQGDTLTLTYNENTVVLKKADRISP